MTTVHAGVRVQTRDARLALTAATAAMLMISLVATGANIAVPTLENAMSPGAVIMVFVTVGSVPFATRVGYRQALTTGAAIATLGVMWLALFMRPGASYVSAFVPATVCIGTGMGLAVGQLNAAALRSVKPEMLGAANGAFNMLRSLGGTLGVAIVAAVIGSSTGTARTDAFTLAFIVVAALTALSPLLLAVLYRDADAPAASGVGRPSR